MASPRIQVKFPAALKMTKSESASLRSTFKDDVITVIKRRPGELPPFPETNTSGTGPRAGKKLKAGSKKGKKK